MNRKIKCCLIGFGKVGSAFYNYYKSHLDFISIIDKNQFVIKTSGKKKPLCSDKITEKILENTDLIIIAVPDNEITNVVNELLNYKYNLKNKYLFHFSGALTSEVFKPLSRYGAIGFSLHPNSSFYFSIGIDFSQIPFFFEGSSKAKDFLLELIKIININCFVIPKKDKPLYHAISVMISNFLINILHYADKKLFHENQMTVDAYLVLINSTLVNFYFANDKLPLTGPAVRNDVITIEKNIEAIKDENIKELYKIILKETLKNLESEDKENKQSKNDIP